MRPEYFQYALDAYSPIDRAVVVEMLETGEILVELNEDKSRRILCDFLETADRSTISLQPGDPVLMLLPKTPEDKGCVLGRIGRYRSPEKKKEPDNLVIEAKRQLDLKCGKSSVVLRRDGKLVVKAVDVVSRAKRNNKIKGGSVQIN